MSYEHRLRLPDPWEIGAYAAGQPSGPFRASDSSLWYGIPARHRYTGALRVQVFRLAFGTHEDATGRKLVEHIPTPEAEGFKGTLALSSDGRLRLCAVDVDPDPDTFESMVIDEFIDYGGLR